MINGSIQEGNITIVNIYAPNIGAPQYIRQMLTAIKGEIDRNTIIVGDFNTPLSPVDRSSQMKIRKHKVLLFFFFEFLNFIFLYSRFLLVIHFIHISVYMSIQSPNSSHHLPHPPPLSPLGVHTFVLYLCVSISALQTGSSLLFFQVPHICINIRYLFFSF